MTDDELQLARERIREWPREERKSLTRLTEREARLIVEAAALLDIRPVEGDEAAGPASV